MHRTALLVTTAVAFCIAGCSSGEDSNRVDNPVTTASDPKGSMTPLPDNNENEAQFLLHDVAFDFLYDLGGYKADQLALIVDVMAYETINNEINQSVELANREISSDTNLTTIERTQYNCAGGGTLIHEIGRLRYYNASVSNIQDIDDYVFDHCEFNSTASSFMAGEYIVSGTLRILWKSYSGSRAHTQSNSFTWEQFLLDGPDGIKFAVNGKTFQTKFTSFTSATTRTAELDYYQKWVNEQEVESLSNVNFRYDNDFLRAGLGDNDVQIEMSGVLSGAKTNNHKVNINTDSPLHHYRNTSPYGPDDEPFTGQISINSSDRSNMVMSANTSGTESIANKNLLVDWINITNDGTQFTGTADLLIPYTKSAENCDYLRPDTHGPVACTDGQKFVIP